MTNQTKTNNLHYLIDPTFSKFNRLFVLSLENENDRTSDKSFLDVPIESKEETYEKLLR